MKLLFKSYFISISFLLLFSNSLSGQFYYDSIANMVGDSMEMYFYQEDLSYFEKIFNDEAFKSYIKKDSVNELTASFNDSFFEKINVTQSLGGQILNVVEAGDYYSFIKYTYDIDFNYYLLFRLFSEEGINYHEYVLSFNQDTDEYFISDVFIYLSGEYYSTTLNRFYEPTYNDMAEGKVFGPGIRQTMAIQQIESLKAEGNYKKAQKIYEKKISDEYKKGAFGLFNFIELYGFEDLAKYEKYLTEIKEDQKSLSSFYLMSIDKHILAESYQEALDAIDSLYQYTYDDLLELLKGHIHYAAEDYDDAIISYASIIEYYPFFEDGYTNLLALYDELDKEKEGIELLHLFEENIDLNFDAVEELIPSYMPKISQSEAYKNWLIEARKRDEEKTENEN